MSSLPPASPAFAGRDEPLAELLTVLDPGSERPTALVSAVGGMGGVGKTELALQAAYLALSRGWFPGGVLFVDLFGYDDDRRRDPAQALAGLLIALGVPSHHIPVLGEDRSGMFRSILGEFAKAGRRILVVVDNAAFGQPVHLLLPSDGRSAAIVTSRHTLAMLNARLVDLNVLGRAEAVAMLGQTVAMARPGDTRVADAPGEAAELVELCGRLPLAIRIAAALLAEQPQAGVAALVAELRALPLLKELRIDQYGVDAAFRLSYQALTPEQQRVFRMLSINPGPDFTVVTICWLCELPLPQAVTLQKDLARAHLIEPTGVAERWRMHDLIRLYASDLEDQHSTEDERDTALSRLLEGEANLATGVLAYYAPGTPEQAAHGPAFGVQDKQWADYWMATELENMTAAAYLALSQDGEVSIDLPLFTAALLMHRKSYSQARALAAEVRILAHEAGEVVLEGQALLILAVAGGLSWRRMEDVIAAYEEAKAIFQATGDQLAVGQAALGMGEVYSLRGDSTEAVAMQREAAAVFRELGDRRWEAAALVSVGRTLELDAMEEATIAYLAAGEIFGELGEPAGQAAMLMRVSDKLPSADAIAWHTQALGILRAAGMREDEAIVLVRLGTALADAGRAAESIEVSADAAVRCAQYGLHKERTRALTVQARALARLGRYDEAVAACRDAADAVETAHDVYWSNELLRLLAELLLYLGRTDEALSAMNRAVTAISDRNHLMPETLNQLGQIELLAGRPEAALETFTRSQAIAHDSFQTANAAAASLLAVQALFALERIEEAAAQLEAGLTAYRSLGNELGIASAILLQAVILLADGSDDQSVLDLLDQAAPALLCSPDRSAMQARADEFRLAAMRAFALHSLGHQDESLIAYHAAATALQGLDAAPCIKDQLSGMLRFLEDAYAAPAPRRARRLLGKVRRHSGRG
jgi:tetratricopeptide (TPR) repeat protein